MTDLDEQLTDHLRRRAAAVTPRYNLEAIERSIAVELVQRGGRPNRRPRIAVLAAAAAAAAIVGAILVNTRYNSTTRVGSTDTSSITGQLSAFVGSWISTDIDGSEQTMEVGGARDGSVGVTIHQAAWGGTIVRSGKFVCSGAAATLTGTGAVDPFDDLVVAIAALTCEDGSEPVVSVDRFTNRRFARDDRSDTLTDDSGVVWRRAGVDDLTVTTTIGESPASPTAGGMWPQSTSVEVKAAQRLADAGDPAYTWQVDRQLSTGDWRQYLTQNPNTVEIAARFLHDQLGWDSYLVYQGGDPAESSGEFTLYGFVYLRCAPGATNTLYPVPTNGVPSGELCAPTIDELRYEAVTLNLSQLVEQGPDGIWVVNRWHIIEPFTQADPRVVESAATDHLEGFLQARITGEDAEGYVGVLRHQEVPLLYTTTSGAPYERSEIELVNGPLWPSGWMEFTVRLYAEGGRTVVEQTISGNPGNLSLFPPSTTENGEPVPVPYVLLNGEVTMSARAPWVAGRVDDRSLDRGTEGGGDGRVEFVLDPRPVASGCEPGPVPIDAEALAASIESDLLPTTPVPVSVGGLDGLQVDVTVAPGITICQQNGYAFALVLASGVGADPNEVSGLAAEVGTRLRLFLLDMPEGSATAILAIAVIAPEASFETIVNETVPILDSIKFRHGGT